MGRMAVDAHAWHLRVLDDGIFVEGGKIALIESHLAEHLIAWSDAAIGESPLVEGIGTDIDLEVLVLLPLPILLHADRERELSALVLKRQLVPVVDIEISDIALGMQFSALRAFHDHIDTVDAIVGTIEIQRCDLCRNRHAHIVRINIGQRILHHDIRWCRGAGGEK